MLAAGLELVGEEIGERGHAGARGDESAPDFRAASPDAEDAEPHGGVRGRAAHGFRLDDGESDGGGGGGAEEFPAPDAASVVAH